jgi:multidrug efflux pump subunit AcrA (membrane-fusion protein)
MNRRPLLILLVILSCGCSKKEEPDAAAPAPVQVTAVKQDTIRRTVTGDGVLFARDQAGVMPKISAPIQRLLVQRGDHVKEGQLLAVLESRDLAAAVAESRAQLQQAEANLRSTEAASVPESVFKAQTDVEAAKQSEEAARKILDSRRGLFEQGALARRLVDEAQVAYAQAHATLLSAQEHLRALQAVGKQEQIKTAAAQVEAARSHLHSSEAQLGYAEIHSPIAGIVADRALYTGEMASAGNPIVTVMDISRVVARVNVPQKQAGGVRVGQPALITLPDAAESQTQGWVTVVSPATDPNTTTVQIWIEVANPGDRLKPGASAHAVIISEEIKAATVVPAAAILPGEEGGTAVLIVTADKVAHRRPVQLGVREGDKIQALNGVRPGDEVVIVGGIGLDDKAKVRVVEAGAPEEADEDEEPGQADEKKVAPKNEAKPKAK